MNKYFTPIVAGLLSVYASSAMSLNMDDKLSMPGVMLKSGDWYSQNGNYIVPDTLSKLSARQWPIDNWKKIKVHSKYVEVSQAPGNNGKAPDFLQNIVQQRNYLDLQIIGTLPADAALPDVDPYDDGVMYLRVPGAAMPSRVTNSYVFSNGTSGLVPKLDNRYELELEQKPFSFTVRNSLRNNQGVAYGQGAFYTIEYDGWHYQYELGGNGRDSRIEAIADIDGDGKPDFIVKVENATHIILSSVAKPGKNVPAASLSLTQVDGSDGC